MQVSHDSTTFEKDWFTLAEKVCQHIYEQPNIQAMVEQFKAGKRLTEDERSDFISTANRVKYEVIYAEYGEKGSETFEEFKTAWKHWFNNKKGTSEQLNGRRLTNAEHIVYSSTPDPEEFLSNFK